MSNDKPAERQRFEEWYATHAHNYSINPIGSRDCALQWDAWEAALQAHAAEAAQAQAQAAEPVAITKDSDDLYTGWLSWTGKELPPGTKLYTHPQPAQDAKDAARLDWLEAHPRLASIVIDGSATDCYLYGISGAPGLKLREILDAAMVKESGR